MSETPDPQMAFNKIVAELPGEKLLIRTLDGPYPGTRVVPASYYGWPLPEELPAPGYDGRYCKVSESQLPELTEEENKTLMRGAQYKWLEE